MAKKTPNVRALTARTPVPWCAVAIPAAGSVHATIARTPAATHLAGPGLQCRSRVSPILLFQLKRFCRRIVLALDSRNVAAQCALSSGQL
eukprot:3574361-Prymnesium_polylepis.1